MPPPPAEKCPTCDENRELLTVNEAAALATVNRKTIYRWIRSGMLEHCILPSGIIRVFKDSLIRPPDGQMEHQHAETNLSRALAKETAERAAAGSRKPSVKRAQRN